MSPGELRAGMNFHYRDAARPELTSPTTFEAVLHGERTATTRLQVWPNYERWCRVVMGDRLRFFEDPEMRGRSVLCVATADAATINLATISEAGLEEWSRLEGWLPKFGRRLGHTNMVAVQVRFRLAENTAGQVALL